MTVDEFVQKKVQPQYRDLVSELRVLLRKNMPGVEELISYGVPMYRYDKPVAWITPSKSGVSLGFRDGTAIEDIDKTALRDYIKQAVKLDRGRS